MISIFNFKLDIDKEYIPYINDLIRMSIIQTTVHLLFFTANPTNTPLFGANFLSTLLFIIVGISFYWLVVQKIVYIE